MDFLQIYGTWGAGYACYTLGIMHAKGHTNWKNCVAALATGLFWPVALFYGIYTAHFKTHNATLTGEGGRSPTESSERSERG